MITIVCRVAILRMEETFSDEEVSTFRNVAKGCISVTADGLELRNIRVKFTGIPYVTGPSVTWPQPWAQFILENICTP